MKNILITGQNSYIGKSFQQWVSHYPNEYRVQSISVRTDEWKSLDFSNFDVIYHTAAIVHLKEKDSSLYNKVNIDLTIDIAKKAKDAGVKQFIFLSTMGVYGTETGVISKTTVPQPKTFYAKSKLEAENKLIKLENKDFKVAILRPPLVYGRDCPGNYQRLSKLALKLPVFPDIHNQRSMIYIDNLSEFVRILIDEELKGLFFPQNKDYVNTTNLAKIIMLSHRKEIKKTKMFNWGVSIGLKQSETFRKVFGSFVYSKDVQGGSGILINNKLVNYETVSFRESVIRTEKG